MRGVFFNRILKSEKFAKAKTFKSFDPQSGPVSTAEGRARVEAALDKFEQVVRSQSAGTVASGVFGRVANGDYVRFQALHIRHHQGQLKHEA